MRPANACSRRSPPRKIDGGTNDEAGALERAVGNSRRATLVAEKLGSQSPAKQAALSSSKFSHFKVCDFAYFCGSKYAPSMSKLGGFLCSVSMGLCTPKNTKMALFFNAHITL